MALDIDRWVSEYLGAVKELFGERLQFVGLQGSYGRGEATDDSDIDVVLILDAVAVQDLVAYDQALSKLPFREKVCGFVSGMQELTSWDRADLFQFCHDTTPLSGSIDHLRSAITGTDVRRAILTGACNIYHMGSHNMLHEKDVRIIRSLLKAAVFVMQAIHYDRSATYVKQRTALLPLLAPPEQAVLQASARLREQPELSRADFLRLSELLLAWAGQVIRQYGGKP